MTDHDAVRADPLDAVIQAVLAVKSTGWDPNSMGSYARARLVSEAAIAAWHPALLAEVERLAAERDHWKRRWEKQLEFADNDANHKVDLFVENGRLRKEIAAARAEVEWLKAELAESRKAGQVEGCVHLARHFKTLKDRTDEQYRHVAVYSAYEAWGMAWDMATRTAAEVAHGGLESGAAPRGN